MKSLQPAVSFGISAIWHTLRSLLVKESISIFKKTLQISVQPQTEIHTLHTEAGAISSKP